MSTSPKVTHAQAVQALHTFTTLAAQMAQTSTPPFSYWGGLGPNPYRMTTYNAQPLLVVWLFLVTNPIYLDVLGSAGDFNQGPDKPRPVVSAREIAESTNLTLDAVEWVLDVYRKGTDEVKTAFKNVAQSFDAFTRTVYPQDHCPGDGSAMLWLSKEGGIVDPAATTFPDGSV